MKFFQLITFDGGLLTAMYENSEKGKEEIILELNTIKNDYPSFSELDIDSLIENFQNDDPERIGYWLEKDKTFISIELHDTFEEV